MRTLRKKTPEHFDRLSFLPDEEMRVDNGEGAPTWCPAPIATRSTEVDERRGGKKSIPHECYKKKPTLNNKVEVFHATATRDLNLENVCIRCYRPLTQLIFLTALSPNRP